MLLLFPQLLAVTFLFRTTVGAVLVCGLCVFNGAWFCVKFILCAGFFHISRGTTALVVTIGVTPRLSVTTPASTACAVTFVATVEALITFLFEVF